MVIIICQYKFDILTIMNHFYFLFFYFIDLTIMNHNTVLVACVIPL